MALDHYISQVYLRNFYAPDLKGRMHAIRKRDLKYFTPDSKSICRIDENSTNAYLEDSRAIEKFLKTIEPKYNTAVRNTGSSLKKFGCPVVMVKCLYRVCLLSGRIFRSCRRIASGHSVIPVVLRRCVIEVGLDELR
ncbi:DUF4238 domain-containing protein [Coraliomargarita parva]|uniref:DUF4238 domain-containing protein n=1 Tax=Coraliomargarita parva TaxID=3014050 RepID=UPI003CE59947